MIWLGVDPDTQHTGICLYSADPKYYIVGIIRTPSGLVGTEAIIAQAKGAQQFFLYLFANYLSTEFGLVVERQTKFHHRKSRPEALLKLALVSGVWLGQANRFARIFLPEPVEWKGQIPKEIHHRRVMKEADLSYQMDRDHIVPTNIPSFCKILTSDWTHIIDAIGLAIWASKQR